MNRTIFLGLGACLAGACVQPATGGVEARRAAIGLSDAGGPDVNTTLPSPGFDLPGARVNWALNVACLANPSPMASDDGWGGGSSKCDLVDGLHHYNTWARGLAFTGGHETAAGGPPWVEPAGVRQARIDFGQPRTFAQVTMWWHGSEHTPQTGTLEVLDETGTWLPIADAQRTYGAVTEDGPDSGYSTSDDYTFAPVTGSAVRYSFDNSGLNILGTFNVHGWLYEMEVWSTVALTGTDAGTSPGPDAGADGGVGAPTSQVLGDIRWADVFLIGAQASHLRIDGPTWSSQINAGNGGFSSPLGQPLGPQTLSVVSDFCGPAVTSAVANVTAPPNFTHVDLTNRMGKFRGFLSYGSQPFFGASLTLDRCSGAVDSDGAGPVSSFLLPVGQYAATVWYAGLPVATLPIAIIPGQETNLGNVDLAASLGRLAGTVSWQGTPVSADESTDWIVDGERWAVGLGDDGAFSAEPLVPSDYQLRLVDQSMGDCTLARVPVQVTAGAQTRADIALDASVGRVAGVLLTAGNPVTRLIFVRRGPPEDPCRSAASVDDAGRFTRTLPPGVYDAEAFDGRGNLSSTFTFTVAAGQTTSFPLLGSPCLTGAQCGGGFCVDGVCCASACGGGATNDCQACSVAAGGTADGQCTPVAAGRVCRASAATCDLVESCDGAGLVCPANTPPAPGTCNAAPTGTGVPITLLGGQSTVNGISFTFANITAPGELRLVETSMGGAPPPSGYQFVLGGSGLRQWDFVTTAGYTGSIKICVQYAPSEVPASMESLLQLVHDDGVHVCPAPQGGMTPWCNITTTVNTTTNVICGTTSSLSPFALMLPVDVTPPVFSGVPGTVVAAAASTAGAKVTYAPPTAIDAVDGGRPVTCRPASGATCAPGKTTVSCGATDAVGNPASATFTVWVQFQAPTDGSFFLAPLRANGASTFRIGRPVPVRFKLTGASKNITNLTAKLVVTKVSNAIQGTAEDTSDETVDDTDFVFKDRPLLGFYAYRWRTKDQTQGTYELRADLGDGVTHRINVSLKK